MFSQDAKGELLFYRYFFAKKVSPQNRLQQSRLPFYEEKHETKKTESSQPGLQFVVSNNSTGHFLSFFTADIKC